MRSIIIGTWEVKLGCLLILLAAGLVSPVQGQDWSRRTRTPEPIESGFLFVDGQFVAGPYQLEYSTEGTKINGHLMTREKREPRVDGRQSFISAANKDAVSEDERGDGGKNERSYRGQPRPGQPRFGQGPRPGTFGPFGSPAELTLQRDLAGNAVVVLFEGRPAVTLLDRHAVEVLRIMVRGADVRTPQTENNLVLDSLLATLPEHADRAAWQNWLTSYQPPELLLARATSIVADVESIEEANYAELSASRRLQDWAYPLTIFGMVMGVLSLGHLLQSPPKPAYLELNEKQQEYLSRAVLYSLGLIVVLSALDLAWTLLASQAGQMAEINPIANQFLGNATLLTLFKAGATLMSCGILLALRHHERAQWAAWWLCLILTLLTFRWLVLNSMFVS